MYKNILKYAINLQIMVLLNTDHILAMQSNYVLNKSQRNTIISSTNMVT